MSDPSRLIRPDLVGKTSPSDGNVSRFRRDALDRRHEPSPVPPFTPSDQALIAAGDADAFERLFDAYADRLCRFINRYVKAWEESEELVQDMFLTLWRRRVSMPEIRDVDAYLYTMARHRALNHLRHRCVEEREARLPSDPDDAIIVGEELAAETQAAIQRAVDTLPARQREVVILRWRDQASYREIMARLGIAEQTVAAHLRKALDHLREVLPRFL